MLDLKEEIKKLKHNLIIVEGKNDKLALEKLGIGNIVVLNNKPLFEIVEEVSLKTREVIILTDLDKEGKLLYHKLKSNLQKFGVKVNDSFRNFLYKNTKLRQIEGLRRYINH